MLIVNFIIPQLNFDFQPFQLPEFCEFFYTYEWATIDTLFHFLKKRKKTP